MLGNRSFILMAALAMPLAALAQTTHPSSEKLVEKYTPLAGSQSNAQSLVTGLRSGSDVTLKSKNGTTTIDPPTKKMGNGNVNIALSLAQASLKQQGITNPTSEQLKAALNGGTIKTADGKTVQMSGVLAMRADGKAWGQIANAMGVKLGEVMRPGKADGASSDRRADGKHEARTLARNDPVERHRAAGRFSSHGGSGGAGHGHGGGRGGK